MGLDSSTLRPGIQLLPADLKDGVVQLYGVLRAVDDLVDEGNPGAAQRVEAIEHWARGEKVDTPETRVLAELVSRYPISRRALIEYCQGMRWDLRRVVIETEKDLEQYCHYVGGTVGVMLAGIFGTSHPDGERKMGILGRAIQRTHILRDIDDDHAHNRLYIARTTIERFGFPTPGAREDLLRHQIAHAERLYAQVVGVKQLFPRARQGIALTVTLYREILRQIERTGYGRTPGRVAVPAWRVHVLSAKHRFTRYRNTA